MIFGIESYFKGINIAFTSGKQLSKYAEGLEIHLHQLKGNRGSLSVQYRLKSHTFRVGIYHTRGGRKGLQARVPLLTQFWLWGEIRFQVLGMLRQQ